MQLFGIIHFWNALHVSGGSSAHYKEHIINDNFSSYMYKILFLSMNYVYKACNPKS